MSPTLLLLFSTILLGTFYLYYLSAKWLRHSRVIGGITLALISTLTCAGSLYLGVLAIQPVAIQGLFSARVARSMFHIEVWPWLVPISALCIFVLWLLGHALKAFSNQNTRRALGLCVAAVACLPFLGYAMFILAYFSILTGPPKTELELIAAFEESTGLSYPSSARVRDVSSHRSDSYGDWKGALIFEAPPLALDTFIQLPSGRWKGAPQWQVWCQELCCDWDANDFPNFTPPDGVSYVASDEEHYKFLALDHDKGTVYFLHSSW